nr:Pyridoxine-5-phosphate oxidase [Caligus rogercresseyi]
MSTDIGSLRAKYNDPDDTFTEGDLISTDPYKQFKEWFEDVRKKLEFPEPNAMCLATATPQGRPSNRIVLLKKFGPEIGFQFFTNCESRKGKELEENPYASAVFYWETLHRCVRIEGPVKRVAEEEASDYFQSRPLGSQIAATISRQSEVVPSRDYLKDKYEDLEKKVEGAVALPKPEFWGGYAIDPEVFEFWQGQSNRLHDRIVFQKNGDLWDVARLAP